MEGFQKIVLYSAIIILIIALVIIGIALSQAKSSQVWPPVVPNCPDYWVADGTGDNATCTNLKDLGTCNGSVAAGQHLNMDFTVSPYNGVDALCNKYKWANTCGVTWDGITNLSTDPCIPVSTST
jgi:hypothetical protein